MDYIELIVNDEALELSDTKLSLTFQAQDLGDISEKLGSYSRSFVIPATSKNRRLLDNAFTFQSSTTIPYSTIPAILKMNGIEIKQGNIIIENDGLSLNAIRLTFYTGNSTFFQRINAIQLSDICMKELEHYWWDDNVIGAREYNTRDYFYPIISYDDGNLGVSPTFNRAKTNYLLPSVKASYILDKISNYLGYAIWGDILNTDLFRDTFFPFSNGDFFRDKNYSRRNTWKTGKPDLQSIATGSGSEFYDLSVANFLDGLPVRLDDSCGFISISSSQILGCADKCKIHYKLTFDFTKLSSVGSNLDIVIPIYNGFNVANTRITNLTSTTIDTVTGIVYTGFLLSTDSIRLGSFPSASNPMTTTIEFDQEYEAHSYIRFRYSMNGGVDVTNLELTSTFIEDLGTLEDDRLIEHNRKLDSDFTRSIVSAMSFVESQSVGSFIKTLAQLYGCILIANEEDRTVEFFSFQKLYDNIGYAKDWTNKVVNINSCNWTTRSGKYGQLNYFRYDNEEGVSESEGQYIMNIEDTTLVASATIIKPPLSATVNVLKLLGTDYLIPQISRITPGFEVDNSSAKQRILVLSSIDRSITYFNQSGAISTESGCVTGYFDQYDFNAYLFDAAYRLLTSVTTQYKELTVPLMLNAVDIQQLDFRIPIYLEQFNAHFYITKISDWQLGTPTKVVLLKLV